MLWQGRQLYDLHFSDASEISFKYNADGIRTEKCLYDEDGYLTQMVTYTLDGSKILREYHDFVSGTDYTIDFIYGGGDTPIGFSINGSSYYYRKNIQGDVTAIVNASGTVVVEYTYDAWGQVLSTTGTLASTIGQINPIRYRGYYCDSETGFYYLQSRYYDPTVGRFINADAIVGTNGNIVGYNMFAYCSNNPVNKMDFDGHFGTPLQWICATIGAVAGWLFGDFVARSIELYDGRWYEWQTWAYWTVRGLVVVGGAILGYVGAGALTKIISSFLKKIQL